MLPVEMFLFAAFSHIVIQQSLCFMDIGKQYTALCCDFEVRMSVGLGYKI